MKTSASIVDIFDKGKAALVILEATTPDAKTGTKLFINRFSLFIRGEGGFGGDGGPGPSNAAPNRSPDQEVDCPTLPQQALLYRLSGDKNPLHADPEFAAKGGFDQPILHGLCTYGMSLKAVVDTCLGGDVTMIKRWQARMPGVVFPGETLSVQTWNEDGKILVNVKVKERDTPVITNAAVSL